MLVSKRQDRNGTFVVDADDLARLDGILAVFGEPRQYTASLADGFVLETAGYETLLKDIDVEHQSDIVDLLATTPWEAEQRATVRLTTKGAEDEPHIEYDLAGSPELMFRQSATLDRWLSSVRPAYSWVATTGWVGLVSLVCGFIAFMNIANMFPSEGKPGQPFNWWTVPALAGTFTSWLRVKLFPGGYFVLGHRAKKAHKQIGAWRYLLLVGVLLATVTSMLATKLLEK